VVCRQNADIADNLQLRDVTTATIFLAFDGAIAFVVWSLVTCYLILVLGFLGQAIWQRINIWFWCVNDVAMEINFGTNIAITGFVWTIVTRLLVMEGVGHQNADIAFANTQQLRDIAIATIFWLSIYGAHIWIWLNHPLWQRCGLISTYFEHL